jgi:hypothetical protein
MELLLILIVIGLCYCIAMTAADEGRGAAEWIPLRLDQPQDWSFIEGDWQESEGVITAPENCADENLAMFHRHAFGDFEAEFDFRWDSSFTTAGFLFRAADVRHYYLLHFPAVGQQTRAEHFWACLSKVGASGYAHVLKMQMVHGVSSRPGIWHTARLAVCGNEMSAWVDRRPISTLADATYPQPGYVGLSTYAALSGAKSSFRNVRVRGAAVDAKPWDITMQPVRNWVVVDPEGSMGVGEIVRTAAGDVLANSARHEKDAGANLLSADNGRTWTVGRLLPQKNVRWGERITRPDGRIESYYTPSGQMPCPLFKAVSDDHGWTWSDARQVSMIAYPDDSPIDGIGSSGLLQLRDGTLVLFFSAVTARESTVIDGKSYYTPKVPGNVMINNSTCIRSIDGGESWSAPINLDGGPYQGHWMVKGMPSEISAVQTADGSVLSLARPFHSPWMWESWSNDSGQTWTPQTRGPFPMYACTRAIACTTSGAILIGGRFPGLAVQVSRDGGMTWTCYRVDTCGWANGAMIEVEPEVVAFLYGGKSEIRGQLLKVTADDLIPLRQMNPTE